MEQPEKVNERSTPEQAYRIRRKGRFWEVVDPEDELVCITVYKCGARELIRRLAP